MSSTNSGSFTFSFSVWIPLFSCLIVLARTFNTMLNKSGKSGHSCIVPDLRRITLSFLLMIMMLVVGLSFMAFIMMKYIPSIPILLRIIFYYKWVLNPVKCFFWIYWDSHIIFILHFLNVVYHIDWFAEVEPSLHPWNKNHLIRV